VPNTVKPAFLRGYDGVDAPPEGLPARHFRGGRQAFAGVRQDFAVLFFLPERTAIALIAAIQRMIFHVIIRLF
jgi:hypothetical protein